MFLQGKLVSAKLGGHLGRIIKNGTAFSTPTNPARPMATEAADEDDEVAHASYHHTHPPGYAG